MNPRIQELKISNLKEKLRRKYSFLEISSIYHGKEDSSDMEFSKMAMNSIQSIREEFPRYDSQLHFYIDEGDVFPKVFNHFKNAIKFFKPSEFVVFDIRFSNENFRIKCLASLFLYYIEDINDLQTSIIVFNESHSKFVSILKLEYSFEVVSWQAS